MPQRPRVIHLHVGAPARPAPGTACNGCGLCCAAEPCPLGTLLSRRRDGACAALAWHGPERRYRCGALTEPQRWFGAAGRRWPGAARRLARRWIAAATGCDCTLQPG